MSTVVSQIVSNNPLTQLVGDLRSAFVGYVYSLRYDECLVQTNDAFKHAVNGLPHNSFLVAAGFDPTRFDIAPLIDQEVVLLRVLGSTTLPQDADMVRTRIEHHQRRREAERLPGDINDGLDPMTASELQWGGMRCRVLGTFFMRSGNLRLGSDIENFMSLSRLRAYKPRGQALRMIVNHVNPEVRAKAHEEAVKAGFTEVPKPIQIGTIRFTSTDRLHRGDGEEPVLVEIQPADFLARRTAVLGMTRTGKSNTVKTTVSAVAMAALKSGIKIGQLIFDINGEYANANHQDDGSSIADVFESQVVRYRAIETEGFEDLRANFYEEPAQALNLIQTLHKQQTSPFGGQDLDTFMSISLEEPDTSDRGAHLRWERHISVFQCILFRAGYTRPSSISVKIPTSKSLVTQLNNFLRQAGGQALQVPSSDRATLEAAASWFDQIRAINLAIRETQAAANTPQIGLVSSTPGNSWVDPTLESMLNILARETSRKQSIAGWRSIQKYTPYHSARRNGDVVQEIIGHLNQGKITILDLSVGPVEIREVLSERIASEIFTRQMSILNRGLAPQNVVLYVEEAHNVVGKKDDLRGTWPRIAKEGAKAKIAFVYATQEPSSVHPNILANTENWFVTHLNNDDELKTLGKFYDFGDFTSSLKAAQDVGFARIKTLSSPFVIPTQINRFTPESIKHDLAHMQSDQSPNPVDSHAI